MTCCSSIHHCVWASCTTRDLSLKWGRLLVFLLHLTPFTWQTHSFGLSHHHSYCNRMLSQLTKTALFLLKLPLYLVASSVCLCRPIVWFRTIYRVEASSDSPITPMEQIKYRLQKFRYLRNWFLFEIWFFFRITLFPSSFSAMNAAMASGTTSYLTMEQGYVFSVLFLSIRCCYSPWSIKRLLVISFFFKSELPLSLYLVWSKLVARYFCCSLVLRLLPEMMLMRLKAPNAPKCYQFICASC